MTATVLLRKPSREELGENNNILYLSVSKTKTFKDCKSKFKFQYIDKIQVTKDRDYLIFGKFLHSVLENFHAIIKRQNDDNKPFARIMEEQFASAIPEYKSLTPAQLKDGHKIMTLYLKNFSQDHSEGTFPDILETEQEFCINIDDKILLNGFIDRVQLDHDGVLHVADYKTSKAKSIKYLKKDKFQLLTYAYVLALIHPEIEKVRASYILLRARQCADCHYTLDKEAELSAESCPECKSVNFTIPSIVEEFSRDQILLIEEEFLEYAAKINVEKAFSSTTSPLCEYCDFLDLCPDGGAFVKEIIRKREAREAKYNRPPKIGEISWDDL